MRLALAWLLVLGCGDRNSSPPQRDDPGGPIRIVDEHRVAGKAGQNIGADLSTLPPRPVDPKETRDAANFIIRTANCRDGDVGQSTKLAIDYEPSPAVRNN